MVFDRELNMPAEVADSDLREVLRRMREAACTRGRRVSGPGVRLRAVPKLLVASCSLPPR